LPPLKIPDRYRPGISILASMSDATFEEIVKGLKQIPSPARDHKELAAWVAPEAKSLGAAELNQLLDTLTSLYRLRKKHDVSPERLANDVRSSASTDGALAVEGEKSAILENRIATVLALDSLAVVGVKAKELQLEAERMLCDARILTDLRPVFGSNVTDTPTAMIIVHTLKLGYHDTNSAQHRDMFIALDMDDIAKLKDTLQRAEDKTRTLKAKLDAAGIRSVDLS
jgi:hypothetical protein